MGPTGRVYSGQKLLCCPELGSKTIPASFYTGLICSLVTRFSGGPGSAGLMVGLHDPKRSHAARVGVRGR